MKRNDWILIFVIVLVSGLFYLGYGYFAQIGEMVVVTVDGVEYGRYDLNENQSIAINDTNVLEIMEGQAYMIEAECPDGLCLYQAAIDQNHESIICLPNRVVVEVESEEEGDYDAIAQ